MIRKFILEIVAMILGLSMVSCESNHKKLTLNYVESLRNEEKLDQARISIREKNNEAAIESLRDYKCVGVMCRFKNIMLSDAFRGNGQRDSSLIYGELALSQGHSLYYVDSIAYGEVYNYFRANSSRYDSIYNSFIDVEYRNKIRKLIEHDQKVRIERNLSEIKNLEWIEKLDSLVEMKLWPSINLIGHPVIGRHPSLLVLHMPRAECEEYLKKIIRSCYDGDDKWMYAENILNNIVMRQTSDRPICFGISDQYIQFGELAIDQDFVFCSLSKALKYNPQFKINITLTNGSSNNLADTQSKVQHYFDLQNVPFDNITWSSNESSEVNAQMCINSYLDGADFIDK